MHMPKTRIDLLLVEKGLIESRSKAQRVVMAGQVRVNGEVVDKPGMKVADEAQLKIKQGPAYVSRGGDKLAAALEGFSIDVEGQVWADVGASTGGFTDCLLQNGAKKVYAIDVGKGILHWKLRQDERVVVMESANARYLNSLPEPIEKVCIDTSFISLKVLLPVIKGWLHPDGGEVVALIKPQFEAGREEAAKGKGVIRDTRIHKRVLEEVLGFAQEQNLGVKGLMRSPLIGPKGNVEFLAYLSTEQEISQNIDSMIEKVLIKSDG